MTHPGLPPRGSSITLTSADDPRIPVGYRLTIVRAEEPNPALQRQFTEGVAAALRRAESKAESEPAAS